MPSSRGSSRPRDPTRVSGIAGGFFTAKPPGKPHIYTHTYIYIGYKYIYIYTYTYTYRRYTYILLVPISVKNLFSYRWGEVGVEWFGWHDKVIGIMCAQPWGHGEDPGLNYSHWKAIINKGLMLSDWLFFFFLPCLGACGTLIPQPGMEPYPLQWKCGVLTTGPREVPCCCCCCCCC